MSKECSFFQVKNMVKFSGVNLGEDQIESYVLQRETSSLSDQVLLASIIAETSPEELVLFISAYPNIFDPKV